MKTLSRFYRSAKHAFLSIVLRPLSVILPFILLTTTAFADGSIQLPPTTLLPPIGHVSNMFVDITGRTVIMHGANIMNKNPPFYFPSFYQSDGNGSTIGEDWAKFYAANGFNLARVGISWAGVELSPGVYNDAYILNIRDMVRMFAKYGVYCILDFHQDAWSGAPITGMTPNSFGGDGFPAWTANFKLNGVVQANNSDPFPLNQYSSPALQTVWDNFWHNVPSPPDTMGVQDRFIKMHAHVAQLFKYEPNLLYYGTISEPVPSLQTWQSLGNPTFFQWVANSPPYTPNILSQGSNATFYNTLMPNFYNKLNAAIHAVDPIHMVGDERSFYEIAGDYIPVVPKPADKNIVLARSFYGSQNSPQSPADFLKSPALAKTNNMGFMAQEWGALHEGNGTASGYLPVVSYMDQNNISWAYWDFAGGPLSAPIPDQTFPNANSVSSWFISAGTPVIAWSGTIGQPPGSLSLFTNGPMSPDFSNVTNAQVSLLYPAGDLSGMTVSMDIMVPTSSYSACGANCYTITPVLVADNGPNFDFIPQLQNGSQIAQIVNGTLVNLPSTSSLLNPDGTWTGSLNNDGIWYHISGTVQPDSIANTPLNDVKQLTLGLFGMFGPVQVYVDNIQFSGRPLQLPVTQDLVYDTTVPPTGNIVNSTALNTMVEPYPRVIAGTPISYQYNPTSNIFTMSYSKKGADGNEVLFLLPTEIFVPQQNYPNGYNAKVSGGLVISAPNSSLLLILRNPLSSTVSVTITSK